MRWRGTVFLAPVYTRRKPAAELASSRNCCPRPCRALPSRQPYGRSWDGSELLALSVMAAHFSARVQTDEVEERLNEGPKDKGKRQNKASGMFL